MPQAAEAPGFFLGRDNLVEWEAVGAAIVRYSLPEHPPISDLCGSWRSSRSVRPPSLVVRRQR
jgi:hypothetical protein